VQKISDKLVYKADLRHLNNEGQECKTNHVKGRTLIGGEGECRK
jgi:hypothetical protein